MPPFRPTRASPPLRTPSLTRNLLEDSRPSTIAIPELIGLTPEEVEFIDAVVAHVPTSTTAFSALMQAYHDLFYERGLDPHNDVVYYSKLLKLGTVRGNSWQEKWDTIKKQQNYGSGSKAVGDGGRTSRTPTPQFPVNTRPTTRLTTITAGYSKIHSDDSFTLHSHPEDTDGTQTEQETDSQAAAPQYHNIPRAARRGSSPSFSSPSNSLGLHTGPSSASTFSPDGTPRVYPTRRVIPRHIAWNDAASETETDVLSTVPPSYGAANYESHRSITPRTRSARLHNRSMSSSPSIQPVAQQKAQPVKEHQYSAINEENAWAKIREAQDIKEADRFRQDKLLERCWDVWRQGYQWIITTNAQIAEARDTLILRVVLRRWQQRTVARREIYERVAALSDKRRMRGALYLWKVKYKEKKQAQYRNSMRARMAVVRERRETKILKDAWAKWRQSHRSHLSDQHYTVSLMRRFFKRWKARLVLLDQMDAAADHLVYVREDRNAERCWNRWRSAMEMRHLEKVMTERVSLRIMGAALDVWKRRLALNRVADKLHDMIIMKRALGAWKGARDRIRSLERRAVKHTARQDVVLVRAVLRVWRAHTHGRSLERVRSARLIKQAWSIWTGRMQHQKGLEELALAFSMRPSSTTASGALQKWYHVYTTHQNAYNYAIDWHSSQLAYKMWVTWRIEMRAKVKMAKQARIIDKYLVQKKQWKKWRAHLAMRRLERRQHEFEQKIVKKYFIEWLKVTRRRQQLRVAEKLVRDSIDMRLMSSVLDHWVNRVVNIKDLELQIVYRDNLRVLSIFFGKWKDACLRHVSRLQLAESFKDIKQEEQKRRMFYRWLTAARTIRHKRLYLQHREEKMAMSTISAAWDRWRERFLDVRLQPMAEDFLAQRHQHLMFRAFGIWRAKTRSLPAVHFHSYNTKRKAWKIWRDAMPAMMQARAARELYRKKLLATYFDKWHKAYKTKMELEAVKRARYILLPTAGSRQSASRRGSMSAPQSIRPAMSGTHSRSPTVDSSPPTSTALLRPSAGRAGIASLLSRDRSPERSVERPASRTYTSASRPKLSTRATSTRAASPTESQTSFTLSEVPHLRSSTSTASTSEVRRSALWQELRGIQMRARSNSDRSPSRGRRHARS